MQFKYNCSVGIGVQSSTSAISVAAGVQSTARFVWGSVTKQTTGASLLQLVEEGLIRLDEPVYPNIDPMLATMGLGPMRVLFGSEADLVTAEHLATMRSGVPDYDTAVPYPLPPTDTFRAEVYAHPGQEYPPAVLLQQPKVAKGALLFTPGANLSYSSTNFILLGLLIARLRGASTWDAFDQVSSAPHTSLTLSQLQPATFFVGHRIQPPS